MSAQKVLHPPGGVRLRASSLPARSSEKGELPDVILRPYHIQHGIIERREPGVLQDQDIDHMQCKSRDYAGLWR